MNFIEGKHITIGITGGIAAYKIPLIIREIIKRGGRVRTIITPSAKKFITPYVLETLTGEKCYEDLFSDTIKTVHIELGKNTDLIVIAPATYNTIGKFASGIADNLLTSVVASANVPIILFPAMNTRMWKNPINQRNINILKDNGYIVIPPSKGELACGEEGEGRLPDIEEIIFEINKALSPKEDFIGKRVLITAGSTAEYIDDVRVITNLSSGRMGKEIAEAIRSRGGDVIFIYGNMSVPLPIGVKSVNVITGKEMQDAIKKYINEVDIIIMAAAIADFKPNYKKGKIKREESIKLELKTTNDIIGSFSKNKKGRIFVGFALESQNLKKNAEKKMKEKGLDIIVGNDIATINHTTSTGIIISKTGQIKKFKEKKKDEVAWMLADQISELFRNN